VIAQFYNTTGTTGPGGQCPAEVFAGINRARPLVAGRRRCCLAWGEAAPG
jgi:hypothetical protein